MSLNPSQVLNLYVALGTAFGMFTVGLVGFLVRRNLLILLMCIELMLNAVNIVFISFAKLNDSLDGQVLVLFSMTLAAAEAAIGLSILIFLFRKTQSVFVTDHRQLKG
jgi:NADH-quinone oxidoreductase subunit K